MFLRVFQTALLAGLIAGALITVVHQFTTTPLILEAEKYEAGTPVAGSAASHDDDGHAHEDGMERLLYSGFVNLIFGAGFALLLVGGFALTGDPIDGRRGLIWGAAGFTSFSLAPALGLPPELPGMVAADLTARQTWWLLTAVATASALWLMLRSRGPVLVAVAIVVLVVPHLIGAPHPQAGDPGSVPPELAAHFTATSLAVAAVFWALLGWLAGTFWARGESTEFGG